MSSYLSGARSAKRTRETEPIFGREREMRQNDAGGFAFKIGSLEQLRRFLILGSEGGTYYTDHRRHTQRNARAVERAIREHGVAAVDVIVDVSVEGRAARQDEALFALAVCGAWSDGVVQERALRALPRVCRTGSSLFTFAGFITELRGWGVRLKKAVAAWYEQRDDVCPHCGRIGSFHEPFALPGDSVAVRRDAMRCAGCTGMVFKRDLRGVDYLAYQMVKYRQRDGWTHKRLIDLSHPKPPTADHESLYQWALGMDPLLVPEKIEGFQWAQLAVSPADTARLVRARPWLPREALKTEHTSSAEVWQALIDARMPMGALVRNLGRMTSYGALKPMDSYTGSVVSQLTNEEALTRARVHPVAILKALATYTAGRGERLSWEPLRAIKDALDVAFYASFGAVEPSGRRTLLAIDVSGSMTTHRVAGLANLTAREAAAAMALVTANVEPLHEIVAFSSRTLVTGGPRGGLPPTDLYQHAGYNDWCIAPLDISPRMRLVDAVGVMRDCQAGATDLSMPMLYAQQKGLSVDTFVVYTDNESYAGRMHPSQALKHYRASTGIKDARLVVVAMTATSYSVADPTDPGMLDVVGFDTAAPGLISAFSRGEV